MPYIYIVPINSPDYLYLQPLADIVSQTFNIPVKIDPSHFDPSFAFDTSRDQYNSTVILSRLIENVPEDAIKIIGVTDLDLYVPVLTFVFGEAQLDGPAAVVSLHRLRNQFYGLPKNDELLKERFEKEVIHELGHTFGLIHCNDYECVMHSSTYAEEIDLKSSRLCQVCSDLIRERREMLDLSS